MRKLDALRAHLAEGIEQASRGDFVDDFDIETIVSSVDAHRRQPEPFAVDLRHRTVAAGGRAADVRPECVPPSDPSLFAADLESARPGSWIVVDEIQRLPNLLNEVHRFIEERRLKFALTASTEIRPLHLVANR